MAVKPKAAAEHQGDEHQGDERAEVAEFEPGDEYTDPVLADAERAARSDERAETPTERRARLQRELAELDVTNPAGDEPEEMTHVGFLECGHTAELPNTNSTHHHCAEHGVTVGVRSTVPRFQD